MVHPDYSNLTPLPFIFQLLHAKNVKGQVLTLVTNIIHHLLDDDNADETIHDQQGMQ